MKITYILMMSVISLSFIGEADLHEDILRKFVANDRFLKNDPYPKEFCITAFHRVVRYGRLPMLVVLEKIGKRLHTRGFLKYVTEEERRTQPHIGSALYDKKKGEAYHEWCEDVNARLGYIHPFDLRELVDDFSFFRLERLPCREFPEGEAFLVPSSSSKGK